MNKNVAKFQPLDKNVMNALSSERVPFRWVPRYKGDDISVIKKSSSLTSSSSSSVVDEMPLKSALTQIPGIVFLVGIVENLAGPQIEVRARKLKPSLHSTLTSFRTRLFLEVFLISHCRRRRRRRHRRSDISLCKSRTTPVHDEKSLQPPVSSLPFSHSRYEHFCRITNESGTTTIYVSQSRHRCYICLAIIFLSFNFSDYRIIWVCNKDN